ncbi:hypothetical protein ACLOJK_023051 [Asimina triloba]
MYENTYCAFHQERGHGTERCLGLKHAIQDLIDQAKVDLEKHQRRQVIQEAVEERRCDEEPEERQCEEEQIDEDETEDEFEFGLADIMAIESECVTINKESQGEGSEWSFEIKTVEAAGGINIDEDETEDEFEFGLADIMAIESECVTISKESQGEGSKWFFEIKIVEAAGGINVRYDFVKGKLRLQMPPLYSVTIQTVSKKKQNCKI